MIDDRLLHRAITEDTIILRALKQMDELGVKSLIVLQKLRFVGIVSIGDIQRAIIQNQNLNEPVKKIIRSNPKIGDVGISLIKAKSLMLKYRMELLPIINEANEITQCYFWEDLFPESNKVPTQKFNLPVVIMAGGYGRRLKPLTNVIPKPLIPLGDKTMIEEIFERFAMYGCNSFHISLNYKADLIKYYIKQLELPYRLNYFQENKPLGTAGSLNMLSGKINSTFFVTNCDILIEQDYSEILDYHYSNKNEITVVSTLRHYPIPYGTIETGANGKLLSITEKPEITLKINSGMYILEPSLLNEIPKNSFYHITQLIEKVLMRKGVIGVFPISEKSWKDLGNWEDFKQYLS